MSETVQQFAGLSLSKIGDLGVHILQIEEVPPTHPQDEKAIEEAIEIQARRRAVRKQVHEALARVGASSIEREAASRR